mmetsp:Transcript_110408/g.216496  ORF Transcript_110408/g.216496 Transcript_110408/m.216496 type:complete len:380 (-) Transcript_110408:798-1937(-)
MDESDEVGYFIDWLKKNPMLFLPDSLWEDIAMEDDEEDEEEARVLLKKIRCVHERTDNFEDTPWMKLLNHPSTYRYKLFRRRFRVPCPLFRECLMPLVRSRNIFNMVYASKIPLEIKVMISLRILGGGSCCDDMCEMSGVGESTCNRIFHTFVVGMSKPEVLKMYVKPPVEAKLAAVMDTYARLGFPGAVGSIDCTHVQWNKCPVELVNLCRGKEKYPSLTFEVVVDHSGLIHSVTDGFVGTYHDAIVVVHDEYAIAISEGMYADKEFSLYDEQGRLVTYRGGYLISDAGYTKSVDMFLVQQHQIRRDETLACPVCVVNQLAKAVYLIFLRKLPVRSNLRLTELILPEIVVCSRPTSSLRNDPGETEGSSAHKPYQEML